MAFNLRKSALLLSSWCFLLTSWSGVRSEEGRFVAFDPGAYLSAALPTDLRRNSAEALEAERKAYTGTRLRIIVPPCTDDKNGNGTVSGAGGPPCPPSKYRSATGECNNVRHRLWGRRGDVFLRLLPAHYEDSISAARRTASEWPLPPVAEAARAARVAAAPDNHRYVNSLLAAWGQMLLDDLAATANAFSLRSKCCRDNSTEACHSVCSEYSRSAPGQDVDSCRFQNREQLNLATGFLDGSALYGSTEKELRSIRLYDGGKLDLDACRKCKSNSPAAPVYKALLSEHNRIATALLSLNPHWDDNTIFLESRRALAATVQHITYTEFLDSVLGEVGMAKAELRPMKNGFYGNYSSSNRAGVFSEAAVSALPVFQSMIHKSLYNVTPSIASLLATPARMPSVHLPPSEDSDDATSDLIDKGRDHGLPSYPFYINLCEKVINSDVKDMTFEDLSNVGVNNNNQELLRSVYGNLTAVDLVVGAIMETPASGAVLGSTLACILTNQFGKLRISDRFWYENDLPPSSFSAAQLRAIKRVSMAGLACTSTNIEEVQPKAFVTEDAYLNAPQSCEQHTHLELSAWSDPAGKQHELEEISKDMIHTAVEKAKREMMSRKKLEYLMWEQNGGADPKSPVGTAASFSKANKQALKLANSSLFFEFATNEILNIVGQHRRRRRQTFDSNILGFNPGSDFVDALQSVDVSNLLGSVGPIIEPKCDENGPCDATSPFRTMTGHCNNLRNPNLGKSLTTFARLLPPVYEDGVSRPRISAVTGAPLPSPRVVSTLIHPDISNLHNRYTLMVMQFAQFLDHDLTMTPIHKGFHESIPNCRSCDSPRTVHPECSPFPVPRGDHYYPEVNVTSGERLCFPFMRSLPGQLHLGPREQVNQNTAFLDASAVYGENPCVLGNLRGFGGRMNATDHPVRGRELLPRSDSHPECKTASGYCFIAGDGRASEQPALTAIHTIFLREHNRIVEGLRGVNPHWSGDQLFDHARRIVSAEFQHMTFNEFLPRILSWNAVNLYGLKLLPTGYYKEYSPTCNPSVVNEFAAAAYRIGHSMLRPHLPRMSPSYQPIEPPILLRDGFFKVDMFLQPSMTEELLRGLVSTPMETLDQFITGEVTNHLFEDRKIPFSGIDLVALNVQRARDHGIPSYNNYRALCNLKRAETFDDLSREIPQEVISRFKRIYPTVDDIDLFPGGMSERPLQGGLVGPTFACIIAIQFRQIRKCDRFWYENEDAATRFTEAQLAELRKMTLSKFLCENFDIQTDMQRAAFDLPSNFLNPRVPCHSLPQMDLSAWRETSSQGCHIAGRNLRVGESAFPSPCTSCICTDEGAQCASLRITDCAQLAREWSRDAILRDDVCAAQCGGLLGNGDRGSRSNPGLAPPPRRTRNRGSSVPFKGPNLSSRFNV